MLVFNLHENEKTTKKTIEKILGIIIENLFISIKEISKTLGNISDDRVRYHINKLKN